MPYWICTKHNKFLEPSGHSAGPGVECWPGISYDYETHEWTLDSSELACPEWEEEEDCNNAWEWVETLPDGEPPNTNRRR